MWLNKSFGLSPPFTSLRFMNATPPAIRGSIPILSRDLGKQCVQTFIVILALTFVINFYNLGYYAFLWHMRLAVDICEPSEVGPFRA